MNNLVKGLLKGQEERRMEIEKGFVVERRSLGEKLAAELSEALIALGCEDMLNTKEAVVNKIEIKKGKIVEIKKEVKISDKNEIKALKDKMNKDIAKYKKTAATWQSKYNEIKKELEETNEAMHNYDEEIKEANLAYERLEEQLKRMKKANRELRKELSNLQADIETDQIDIHIDSVVKEIVNNKEEKTKEMNTKLVKLEKYKNERRDDVAFYNNDKYYVMASDICRDITVIPKNVMTIVNNDIVNSFQKELAEMGYRIDRDEVSPAKVYMDNGNVKGYFARTEARDGLLAFSDDDFFGGYITNSSNSYLWSWDGKSDMCAVYNLDAVIVGNKEKRTASPGTIKMVTKLVKAMYKDYLSKVEVLQKEKNDQIAKNTAIANEKKALMDAHNAMFEDNDDVIETPAFNKEKEDITSNLTDITQSYLNGF